MMVCQGQPVSYEKNGKATVYRSSTDRFPRSVSPDDYSYRTLKLDHICMLVIERSDPSDGEFIQRRPVDMTCA